MGTFFLSLSSAYKSSIASVSAQKYSSHFCHFILKQDSLHDFHIPLPRHNTLYIVVC